MTERPTATSAPQTHYCSAKVEGPNGHLWVDGNGKITASNGTLAEPKPNAFSLMHIEDCPQSTPSCRAACYVHALQKANEPLYALYRHNSEVMRRVMKMTPLDAFEWAAWLADWIESNVDGEFRWHVSGDVFCEKYASWISEVCRLCMNNTFWIYTRSFDLIEPLYEVSTLRGGNLAINLSCDADNYEAANKIRDALPGVRVCYMTLDGTVPDDLEHGSVIFPDYSLRGGNEAGQQWWNGLSREYKAMVCPVDYHGKSEQRRCGPCDRCMK